MLLKVAPEMEPDRSVRQILALSTRNKRDPLHVSPEE